MGKVERGPISQAAPGVEQFEPGSNCRVLRNKLAITRPEVADKVEAALLLEAQRRTYLAFKGTEQLSVSILQSLHRDWLGTLYPFAGKIRTIDLAKDMVRFAPVGYLDGSLRELDRVFAENSPCEGIDPERLVVAIARTHAELVLVHPFREGNGRLSRWVAELMAIQAGYPSLDW